MNKLLATLFCLTAFWLSGCLAPTGGISSPSHFYRLDVNPPADNVTAKDPQDVKVLIKVQVSDALRGPRMVVARSDFELNYLETHRWAEPLGRALGRSLVTLLKPGYAAVEAAPVTSGYNPDYRVDVMVEELWGNWQGEAIMDARWTISDSRENPLGGAHKVFRQKGWTQGDYRELAEKISKLTPELAEAIKSTLDEAIKSQKK